MSHANAALTPKARLKIARLIVDEGWSVSTAAKQYMVSWPTAKRWADRYRAHGEDGMADKPSRPRSSPNRTPQAMVKKIVALRWRKRMGPVQIAFHLGLAASTVHAVLVRCRINRLRYIDRITGEPIRRYEHSYPGAMIHVDVTKFGNVPDGGGHRFLGRQAGEQNSRATANRTGQRTSSGHPRLGTAFVHTVIDDHSRIAYAEIHNDEKALTAIAVLERAVAWFAARDVEVERVLSDNGSAYRSHAWRDACTDLGIKHKRTRPYRPQTNGKIERFHRTLNDGWAYARLYGSETARREALPAWIHEYNHHRPHTAIGNQPPISRLTNVAGQYS
ncbi:MULTISPECIES: IS481 family transposase [Brevibacterium]|uniref:IS481 family transposase n=1 Tax=Brevibacterium TaxID=1696 RepID=UPI0031DE6EEC